MNNKKGFTLIELLVVVAIISLLTSVVLASLGTSKQKAQNAKVLQERRSVELAVQIYLTNNNAYPYPGNDSWHCLASTNCVLGGTTYLPSSAGQLALFEDDQDEGFALVNTAHALFANALASRPLVNPTVSPSGSSYAGPLYRCTDYNGSVCSAATLLWTVYGSACPNATVLFGSANGSVCISDAAGAGATSAY